jgi:hypothetical protein
MTVKQLIEILQQIEDQNTTVMVRGYERGVDDIVIQNGIDNNTPAIQQVALNVNEEWYYGKHETVEGTDIDLLSNYTIVNAIIL